MLSSSLSYLFKKILIFNMCIILTDINSVFSHHNPMRFTEQAAFLSTHADCTQIFMVWPSNSHYCWCHFQLSLTQGGMHSWLSMVGCSHWIVLCRSGMCHSLLKHLIARARLFRSLFSLWFNSWQDLKRWLLSQLGPLRDYNEQRTLLTYNRWWSKKLTFTFLSDWDFLFLPHQFDWQSPGLWLLTSNFLL